MSSKEHKDKIWNYIKEIKVGMLTTLDDGTLNSRPMHLVQNEYDNKIWFFTNRTGEKITEIINHNKVCLNFSDPKSNTYVSLSGNAMLTQNKNLIEKFWNPFVAAWFPEGKDSDEVALIEIKIESGEHWDSNSNSLINLFKIAKANIKNETPNIGENQKFE